MPSLVLSFNGEMVREFDIDKPRLTIGRRPQNDIVIDNIAVSGHHATLIQNGDQLILEDDGSSNGTRLNGNSIERHVLQEGDVIEIGKYHLKYFAQSTRPNAPTILERSILTRSPFAGKQLDPDAATQLDIPTQLEPFPTTFSPDLKPQAGGATTPQTNAHAVLKVLNGKQAGKEIQLNKPITTIGKKGVQVAVITRHHNSYYLNHVEGRFPIVNGATINDKACPLNAEDQLEFSGVKMRFEFQ